jgi:sporadic carbohydrate cluster 2OG-Fe(II) oxygenase
MENNFYSKKEMELSSQLVQNGYIINPVDDKSLLDNFRNLIVSLVCEKLNCPRPDDLDYFLENIHHTISSTDLNEFRLHIFRKINEREETRSTYFHLGRSLLFDVVGNELAMQNKVNLSIQMPNDNSSLLDMHSDVYGGESPFQVVQWLPLVNVSKSQSMFILPAEKSKEAAAQFKSLGNMQELFGSLKKDLIWLDIPYGSVLIFDSSCLHGNIINSEKNSRWSLNSRFKGLFTPYISAEKKLGSFYLPITTKAASKIGLNYEQPQGFEE